MLPLTLIHDYPNVASLSEYLSTAELEPAASSTFFDDWEGTQGDMLVPAPGLGSGHGAGHSSAVAVVAQAARLPGDMLAHGMTHAMDAVVPIGAERWETDRQTYLTGSMAVRFAGLLQVSHPLEIDCRMCCACCYPFTLAVPLSLHSAQVALCLVCRGLACLTPQPLASPALRRR